MAGAVLNLEKESKQTKSMSGLLAETSPNNLFCTAETCRYM